MSPVATSMLHEKELFLRISRGDEAAFSQVFFHYTPHIYPFIQKMTRCEEITEEIVQDVFINLWRTRHRLPEIQHYSAYIFKIASNTTFNYLKVKAREAIRLKELSENQLDLTNNTLESIDVKEKQHVLNHLINRLTPQKRLIFQLTREGNMSHDEIAERLNISKNTVKNHLVETLKFLRKNLAGIAFFFFS